MAALRRSLRCLAPSARSRIRSSEADGQHNAFSWLGEGLTTTATARGRLLPALHSLDVNSDWILFDGESAGRTWGHRLKTYADADEARLYAQQMEDSRGAQKEVLDLLLKHLPRRYPDHFELIDCPDGGKSSADTRMRVSCRDFQAEYRVGDYLDLPLRLASLLVQEDLVIMRDHMIVAGTVHFSFSRFGMRRFGMDMKQLHANVPQYAEDLQRPVSRFFDRLTPERPCWRTNWNLAWSPTLMVNSQRYPIRTASNPDEKAAALTEAKERIARVGFARATFLKVEYQTLRRLPQHTNCMLFTVRTFIDPFTELANRPTAARNLAANIRRLEEVEFSKYLGIDDPEIRSAMLEYADGIASGAEADI